jgi:hypothetical protein
LPHKCNNSWHQDDFLWLNRHIAPMTLYFPKLTHHYFPFVTIVGNWYTKFETLLLASYPTTLKTCKELGWNPNTTHKHYLETIIILNSSTKIVDSSHPLTCKVAIISSFLLEFKWVTGKIYEIYTSWRHKTSWNRMQVIMKLKVGKHWIWGKQWVGKSKLKLNVQL